MRTSVAEQAWIAPTHGNSDEVFRRGSFSFFFFFNVVFPLVACCMIV